MFSSLSVAHCSSVTDPSRSRNRGLPIVVGQVPLLPVRPFVPTFRRGPDRDMFSSAEQSFEDHEAADARRRTEEKPRRMTVPQLKRLLDEVGLPRDSCAPLAR